MINESYLKSLILSKGVVFTKEAKNFAIETNAKLQNFVYNAPKGSDFNRPQEIFIKSSDYTTVSSCVSPYDEKNSVIIDYEKNLYASFNEKKFENIEISYVPEPSYYKKTTLDGLDVKRLVSACGHDELNIWPWHDCLISSHCKFCGINSVIKGQKSLDILYGKDISKNIMSWYDKKEIYIKNLIEAINISKNDSCYDKHMHVILISGNLSNDLLDLQAEIYSYISANIKESIKSKSTEGMVAVTVPPKNKDLLQLMKDSGINIIVFNLEVGNEPWFTKYCPGKSEIGMDFYLQRLEQAVSVFGRNKVWCNFVFGLEPVDKLLEVCEKLAKLGIVPGANVLHVDKGSNLDCLPPEVDKIIYFYKCLGKIYKDYSLTPYYCQNALRTSLSNEAFYSRLY